MRDHQGTDHDCASIPLEGRSAHYPRAPNLPSLRESAVTPYVRLDCSATFFSIYILRLAGGRATSSVERPAGPVPEEHLAGRVLRASRAENLITEPGSVGGAQRPEHAS